MTHWRRLADARLPRPPSFRALAAETPAAPARHLSNLGVVLLRRYESDHDREVLDEDDARVVVLMRQAAGAATSDRVCGKALTGLRVVLHRRYRRHGALDDLAEAARSLSAGIAASPTWEPSYRPRLQELGEALHTMLTRTRTGADQAPGM